MLFFNLAEKLSNLPFSHNKLKTFFIFDVSEIAVSHQRKGLSISRIYLSFCRSTLLKRFKVFKEFPGKNKQWLLGRYADWLNEL